MNENPQSLRLLGTIQNEVQERLRQGRGTDSDRQWMKKVYAMLTELQHEMTREQFINSLVAMGIQV